MADQILLTFQWIPYRTPLALSYHETIVVRCGPFQYGI